MSRAAAVLVPVLVVLPAFAQEPTLAEAAAQHKKARKGTATKVITDTDLQDVRTKAYVAAESSGASSTQEKPAADLNAPKGPPAKSDDQVRAEKKAEFEAKIKQWDGFIADTQKEMDKAQLELNDLTSMTWGSRRAGLQKILDEGAKHIAEAKQAIEDLTEEARRAGIPISR